MSNFPIENRVKLTYNTDGVMHMSEYCLDCWNEINETNDPKEKYILSKELDFCEGCGQWKPVIVRRRIFFGLRRHLKQLSEKE